MSTSPDEKLLRATFATARDLEPSDAEVAAVMARVRDQKRPAVPRPALSGLRRLALPILAVVALATSGYAAVPPVRAALDDVADTFGGFLAGDDSQAPGRPLRRDESAAHGFPPEMEPRVIAEADGYQLQFVRVQQDVIEFDLGETGVGLGFAVDDLRGHAVYVLGPGAVQHADEHGHVPLFGVTAPQVRTVELTYESGPPLRVDGVEGGFVLLAEPTRNPQEVVGYDATGEEIERASLHNDDDDGIDIDWDAYGPPAERLPIECQPGLAGPTPPPGCPGN